MSFQAYGYSQWHDVCCDICREKVRGNLYKCNDCRSLYICSLCFKLEKRTWYHSPKKHCLQTILCELDRIAQPIHESYCKGCQSLNFPGRRYKCNKCLDINFCQECYERKRFGSCRYHQGGRDMDYYEPPERNKEENYLARAISLQNQFGYRLAELEWATRDIRKNGPWADKINLGKKIGYAYYGQPTRVPPEDSFHYGYTDKQDQHITDIINTLLELEQKRYSGASAEIKFVFASYYNVSEQFEGTLPLILLRHGLSAMVVEPNGRAYSNWDDFLDKNLLPEAVLVYPAGGIYKVRSDGYLNLVKGQTADCDTSRKIAKGADIGTGIFCTAIGIVAGIGMFTPFAPLAGSVLVVNGIVGGTYGTARGAYKLTDRALHNQTIIPTNAENFFDWLSIVGSVASFGAMGSAAYAARGVALSQTTRILLNTSIFGNMAISAIGTTVSTSMMISRWIDGHPPTPLQFVQVVSSIIFFTASLRTFKTSSDLITQGAQEKVNEYRAQLRTEAEKTAFDAMLVAKMKEAASSGKASGDGRMHGLLGMISEVDSLKTDGTFHEFFAHDSSKAGARHCVAPDGYVKGEGLNGITVDESRLKAFHRNSVELRGQSHRPADRQSPTTAIHMTDKELNLKIQGILKNNRGGSWVENFARPGSGEKIVTLDFADNAHPGAQIFTTINGEKVQNIAIDKFSVVVDSNGKPVHFRSQDSIWNSAHLDRRHFQNLKIVPAYTIEKGKFFPLHGVRSPFFDDDEEIVNAPFHSSILSTNLLNLNIRRWKYDSPLLDFLENLLFKISIN